jgi:uncharacterized protein (TIGR02145 family)
MKKTLLFASVLLALFSCKKEEKTTTTTINPTTTETVKDIDGNSYKTVKIGAQTWMSENLRVTKLNDGTAIGTTMDSTSWMNAKSPYFRKYDANTDVSKDGYLYNFYAVNTQKVCPTGWHVPSTSEWDVLKTTLGGEEVAGGKMKEVGTTGWIEGNAGATNESGFTALASGCFNPSNGLAHKGIQAYFWSSTSDSIFANYEYIYVGSTKLAEFLHYKNSGFSIRCLKD